MEAEKTLSHYSKRLGIAIVHTASQGSFKYETDLKDLKHILSPGMIEQLEQLVNQGPVWDGDVIAKSLRDTLIELGLATRVCVKGEQGYTAATYLGYEVIHVED